MVNKSDIKVGSFIQGSYKFGFIAGIVVEIKSKIVVINKCYLHYNQCEETENKVNVTISRIRAVGTIESLGFRKVTKINTDLK